MSATLTIGTWIERESRDIRQCPSYYAADHETLRTRPGEYPVRLTFENGYTCPMPYWVLIAIDADRIDGATYSGFGGVNFASRELPKGPAPYHYQGYSHSLQELVASGRIVLFPEFAGLASDAAAQVRWAQEKGWPGIAALRTAQEA